MMQYYLKFGLYEAVEGGLLNVGHVQIELLSITASGELVSMGLFEAMPSSGNLASWLNPFSTQNDGYIGYASETYSGNGGAESIIGLTPWEADNALAYINQIISNPEAVNGQRPINYSLSGLNGYSCYSFADEFYRCARPG